MSETFTIPLIRKIPTAKPSEVIETVDTAIPDVCVNGLIAPASISENNSTNQTEITSQTTNNNTAPEQEVRGRKIAITKAGKSIDWLVKKMFKMKYGLKKK